MSRPFHSFVVFLTGLSVVLTPAQRVLCMVAFDGVQPIDLPESDRELARQLFGDVDIVESTAREVIAAICGARAGKTYILIALRLLYLALTVPLDSLAPGEFASAPIIAPDMRLALQAFRYVLGAIDRSPTLRRMVTKRTDSSVVLARGNGHSVVIECLPASRGGSAGRGRSLVGAGLDEASFFRDESSVVCDVDVYKALAPRIMPGGQLIIATTPWAQAGLAYDLFEVNHGRPKTALTVHAPTVLLRPDARTRAMVEREEQRDAQNAAREFGAQFLSAGSGLFFDPATIDAALTVPHL